MHAYKRVYELTRFFSKCFEQQDNNKFCFKLDKARLLGIYTKWTNSQL